MYLLGMICGGLERKGHRAETRPLSDITVEDRKISGNAQARKRFFMLHHGTILYDLDLSRIAEYVKHPPDEPEYRERRAHPDFLTNIPAGKEELKRLLTEAFSASGERHILSEEDTHDLGELVSAKYSRSEWNCAF